MTHAYICECNSRRCRRRIHLTIQEFRVLSRIGMVMSDDCARRERRTVVTRYNGYRVVVAQNNGKATV